MSLADRIATYIVELEQKLAARSDHLEEVHMEAAIDAQLIETPTSPSSSPSLPSPSATTGKKKSVIFDDYTNPNAVENCLSPYVPSSADRIAASMEFACITPEDVLLDIGCGDGRVCVAASKVIGCRSVGMDVSPLCINMANKVASEEGVMDGDSSLCEFFLADATMDPEVLLSLDSFLASSLKSVTLIYLYTYPTLLTRLIPLISRLLQEGKARAVVTLTYHLPWPACRVDKENDIQMYDRITDS